MAELSKSGTYVKFVAHAWMDRTTGAIKVNSADPEIKALGGIHFTGKQGSKTRETLTQLLDNYGCGPKAASEWSTADTLKRALDRTLERVENATEPDEITKALKDLQTTVDDIITLEQEV